MKKNIWIKSACTIFFLSYMQISAFSQNSEGFKYEIGQEIPNLNLKDYKGNSFNVHDLKGKPIIINMFATWCSPCKKEMKLLSEEISSKYKKSQIEVIAIGYDHIPLEIEYFVENHQYNFSYIPDFGKKASMALAADGVPRCIVIDKNGIILDQKAGFVEEEFRLLLEKIKGLIEL